MRIKSSLAVLALLVSSSLGQAAAQTFPSKPIRIIVPFTPGGSPDLLARTVGQKLQTMWGQPVIVENYPGAGGAIAAQLVARSPADGYTWMVAPNSVLVFGPLLQKASYDPVKSYAHVGLAISVQNLLVVHPSVPARDLKELLALAKAKPGHLTYASAGAGSPQNFSMELLKSMTSTSIVHVPYKGAQAAMPDLLGGLVNVFLSQSNSLLPHVEAGKVRLLAGTGTKRYSSFPNVPTIGETVPGYSVDIWSGFVMPANTPKDVVAKANNAIRFILAMPEVQASFAKQGIEVQPSSPEQMTKVIQADLARWGKVVKEANIKPE